MAHFAQMDGNTVLRVIVVHNNDAPDEASGIAFCKSMFGSDTEWRQTSYSGSNRKNFAGIGFTYDAVRDAFIAPDPQDGSTFDEVTCRWVSPVDGGA